MYKRSYTIKSGLHDLISSVLQLPAFVVLFAAPELVYQLLAHDLSWQHVLTPHECLLCHSHAQEWTQCPESYAVQTGSQLLAMLIPEQAHLLEKLEYLHK